MELVNSSIRPTRVVAWDLLKLFAILLVVYGHCMQHLLEVDVTHNPMFLWISSFHMPLFMALSDLFARRAYQGSFKDFLVKRGRQVLLPCLSWSLIIYIVLAFLDRDIHIHGIRSFAVNTLWFLKSVFVCGFLGFVAFKPQGKRVLWVTFSLLLSQVTLVWNVFIMYPCFLFGIGVFSYLSEIMRFMGWVLTISGLLFVASSLYVAFTPDFWVRNQGIREALFSGTLSLTENALFLLEVVFKRYFQLFIGLSGSMFFITLFYWLFADVHDTYSISLAKWGQYTLGVYVIQSLLLETLLVRWVSFGADTLVLFDMLIGPLLTLLVVVICLWVNYLIILMGRGKISLLLLGRDYSQDAR